MRAPVIVAMVVVAACASPRAAAAPLLPPCSGDSTIYTFADTTLGVHPARVTSMKLPEFNGTHGSATVRLLVASDGRVLRDRTKIVSATNQAYGLTVERAAEQYTFSPASRNGCAVAFWFELRLEG